MRAASIGLSYPETTPCTAHPPLVSLFCSVARDEAWACMQGAFRSAYLVDGAAAPLVNILVCCLLGYFLNCCRTSLLSSLSLFKTDQLSGDRSYFFFLIHSWRTVSILYSQAHTYRYNIPLSSFQPLWLHHIVNGALVHNLTGALLHSL